MERQKRDVRECHLRWETRTKRDNDRYKTHGHGEKRCCGKTAIIRVNRVWMCIYKIHPFQTTSDTGFFVVFCLFFFFL